MPYLNREQILALIINKQVYSEKKSIIDQIQPASLDLTLSNKCYRIRASFIPNNIQISKVIKELSLTKIDLSQNTFLEYLSLTNNQITSIDLSNNLLLDY